MGTQKDHLKEMVILSNLNNIKTDGREISLNFTFKIVIYLDFWHINNEVFCEKVKFRHEAIVKRTEHIDVNSLAPNAVCW